jgi:hypothetical protein
MKYDFKTLSIVLFLIFILKLSSISPNKQEDFPFHDISSQIDTWLTKANYSINSMEIGIANLNIKYNSPKNLNFSSINYVLQQAKTNLEKIKIFSEIFKSELMDFHKESVKVENEYGEALDKREAHGINLVNKILKNLESPKVVQKTLEQVNNFLNNQNQTKITEKRVSFLKRKNERPGLRIWSSFRRDEEINDDIFSKESVKGEIIVKSIISGLFGIMKPAVCWKEKLTNGMPHKGLDNIKKKEMIFPGAYLNDCSSKDFYSIYSLCQKKCPPNYYSCGGVICSTDQYCKNPEKFITVEISLREYTDISNPEIGCKKGFYKKGVICYEECANLGMYNCGIGKCASSKEMCEIQSTEWPQDFVPTFLDYVGYLYSIKSNSTVDWVDPINFSGINQKFNKYLTTYNTQIDANMKSLDYIKNDIKIFLNLKENLFADFSENFIKFSPETKDKYRSIIYLVLFDWINSMVKKKQISSTYVKLKTYDFTKCDSDVVSSSYYDSKDCISLIENIIDKLAPYNVFYISAQFAKPNCLEKKIHLLK